MNELFNNQMHQDAHECLSLDADDGSVCPGWRPRGRVFRRIPLRSLHSPTHAMLRVVAARGPEIWGDMGRYGEIWGDVARTSSRHEDRTLVRSPSASPAHSHCRFLNYLLNESAELLEKRQKREATRQKDGAAGEAAGAARGGAEAGGSSEGGGGPSAAAEGSEVVRPGGADGEAGGAAAGGDEDEGKEGEGGAYVPKTWASACLDAAPSRSVFWRRISHK